ncbi:DUF7829 domain-containing protein, partial [Bacteroides thetaiotaomicron]
SCMRGNSHVQFLMGKAAETPLTYITEIFKIIIMRQTDELSDFREFNDQNINNKDENGNGVIQKLFKNAPCNISDYLVLFLQYGYQITCKDRETIRDKCEYEVYKKYATLSRLSFTLYKQGRPDLIMELFNSVDSFIKSIYTIESLLTGNSAYFNYKINVWLCIVNNAITNYRNYWIFCEAALKECGRWEELYRIDSFKEKYDTVDRKEVLEWENLKQYEILRLLYPKLEVPNICIKDKVVSLYEEANSYFKRTELSDTLSILSYAIKKQRPVWGHNDIKGKTAEEKVNSLWNTFPHDSFLEALFYLSDSGDSYIILNQLKKYGKSDILVLLYNSEICPKLRIGLEAGKVRNLDFLLLLWELGYRFHTFQEWQENNKLTSIEQMKLYCLDRFYGNNLDIDLKEIMDSIVLRTICMVEAIKSNNLFCTDTPNWKSYINGVRSSTLQHPLNKYWGYIDMALDAFHFTDGRSMRSYLSQNEPGIKLEKGCENIDINSNIYKALSILYPKVYK